MKLRNDIFLLFSFTAIGQSTPDHVYRCTVVCVFYRDSCIKQKSEPCDHVLSPTKKGNKREMRDAASVVTPRSPFLATVALAVILVAVAAAAAVPRCRCRAALALATTVTVGLTTAVAAICNIPPLSLPPCPRLATSPLLSSSQMFSQRHPQSC